MPQILAPKVLSVTTSICFLYTDGDSDSAEILYYLGIEKPIVKHHCYSQPEAPRCTVMEPGLRIALVVLGVVDISFSLSLISMPFMSGSISPVV